MTEPITIRRAVPGDERRLAVLSAMVQDLHVARRPDVFKRADVPALEDWFRSALTSADTHVVVADIGLTVAGYLVWTDHARASTAFVFDRRWREVEQLGVVPQHQRRGIARALVQHVMESAVADGISIVEASTWLFNAPARSTFEQLGFVARTVRFERRT